MDQQRYYKMHRRIKREKRILHLMIQQYCEDEHNNVSLCADCKELLEYAEKRLLNCPFMKNKPVCSGCEIHCYNKNEQEKIKKVMHTVGPKMIYTHTLDTLWYLFYKLIHKNQKLSLS